MFLFADMFAMIGLEPREGCLWEALVLKAGTRK